MSTATKNPHDGLLTGALADILGALRDTRYGRVAAGVENALRGAADHFVDELAAHLRHEEEALFPALLASDPELQPEIARLREEHRQLRIYAQDLAARIREGDSTAAYETSRGFLAALLVHIDRERKTVDARLPHA